MTNLEHVPYHVRVYQNGVKKAGGIKFFVKGVEGKVPGAK